MKAGEIHSELESEGFNVDGVVQLNDEYWAVGMESDGLPEFGSVSPVDDPSLSDQS